MMKRHVKYEGNNYDYIFCFRVLFLSSHSLQCDMNGLAVNLIAIRFLQRKLKIVYSMDLVRLSSVTEWERTRASSFMSFRSISIFNNLLFIVWLFSSFSQVRFMLCSCLFLLLLFISVVFISYMRFSLVTFVTILILAYCRSTQNWHEYEIVCGEWRWAHDLLIHYYYFFLFFFLSMFSWLCLELNSCAQKRIFLRKQLTE